jgi:anti-anti-sigma factor
VGASVRLDSTQRNGVQILRLTGEIDLSNAGLVRRSVADSVPNDELSVAIDLTDVSYVDSAGVRVFFELARRLEEHQQPLTLIVPEGSKAYRSLEVGGMLGACTIVGTIDEVRRS